MNSRERLTRCYFNQETDRPAVYNRTNYPGNDPSYDKLKSYLQEKSDLKTVWYTSNLEKYSYTIEEYSEKYNEDFERIVNVLHTPAGDLTSSYLKSLKGLPGMYNTYFIKDRDDAEKYLSLPLPEIAGDVSSFFQADHEIGERGIVDVFLAHNPAGFVSMLCGSETFAVMSITDRDILYELCNRRMTIVINKLKYLAEHGVGTFFSMDGEEQIVPPMHGPSDFYDFNVRYDKPIIDLVHEIGGRMHVHSHGSIKKVLNYFVEMQVDVLHPFEAPPMGDITPAEAKKIIRDKVCYEGNIQIASMYEKSPEEIREEVINLVNVVYDDHKGLIVCPTASSYIRGKGEHCFPMYKAMVDTVIELKL